MIVEGPPTPRMPDEDVGTGGRLLMSALIAAVFAWAYLSPDTFPSGNPVLLFLRAWIVLIVIASVASVTRRMWRLRRFVHFTRMLGNDAREEELAVIPFPETRKFLRRQVAFHGEPVVDGLVQRFTFSPVDRTELVVLYVMGAVIAVTAALAALAPRTPGWRLLIGLMTPLSLLVMGQIRQRLQLLNGAIEISPFAVSWVKSEKSTLRVPLDQPLTLTHEPRRRRWVLRPAGSKSALDLPYALVGLEDAVNRILELGHFSRASHDVFANFALAEPQRAATATPVAPELPGQAG